MERADAAIDRAETLSLKLSGLCEMVKLTAFASEARRALKSIHHVLGGYPGANEAITASRDTANQWATMEDNTSSVLECIARQLDECNQKNLQVAYDLQHPSLMCGAWRALRCWTRDSKSSE